MVDVPTAPLDALVVTTSSCYLSLAAPSGLVLARAVRSAAAAVAAAAAATAAQGKRQRAGLKV